MSVLSAGLQFFYAQLLRNLCVQVHGCWGSRIQEFIGIALQALPAAVVACTSAAVVCTLLRMRSWSWCARHLPSLFPKHRFVRPTSVVVLGQSLRTRSLECGLGFQSGSAAIAIVIPMSVAVYTRCSRSHGHAFVGSFWSCMCCMNLFLTSA